MLFLFVCLVRQWWSLRGRRRRWVNVTGTSWFELKRMSHHLRFCAHMCRTGSIVRLWTWQRCPSPLSWAACCRLLQVITPAEKVVLLWNSCWVHLQNWLSTSVDGGGFIYKPNQHTSMWICGIIVCVCVLQEVKRCILTVWPLSRLQQFKWTLSWFCPWISTTISWLATSRPCLGYNHTVALVYISLRTPTYVDLLKLNNSWHLPYSFHLDPKPSFILFFLHFCP